MNMHFLMVLLVQFIVMPVAMAQQEVIIFTNNKVKINIDNDFRDFKKTVYNLDTLRDIFSSFSFDLLSDNKPINQAKKLLITHKKQIQENLRGEQLAYQYQINKVPAYLFLPQGDIVYGAHNVGEAWEALQQ